VLTQQAECHRPARAQVLQDPRQKRFFKARDMSDLFTLGNEYASATETATIFAGLNGEVRTSCRYRLLLTFTLIQRGFLPYSCRLPSPNHLRVHGAL